MPPREPDDDDDDDEEQDEAEEDREPAVVREPEREEQATQPRLLAGREQLRGIRSTQVPPQQEQE
jgi:hypothetical protein